MKTPHPLLLATLAFCQFLAAVDHNIVLVALPALGRDLGADSLGLSWVVSAYALAFGGFLLLGGRLTDLRGPRHVMLLGLVGFGIGSVVAAIAPNVELVLVGRAAQGLGAALLAPAVLSTIAITFAEGKDRFRALSVWSAAGAVGLASGSAIGGVLVDVAGWRTVFMLNALLAVGAIISVTIAAPASSPRRGERLDIAGAVTSAVGLAAVVYALSIASEAGWLSWQVLAAGGTGIVLLLAFLLHEQRTTAPLLPLSLFHHRALSVGAITMVFFMAPIGAAYFVFSVFLQDVLTVSPLATGLAFLPWGIVALGGSVLAKRLLERLGTGRTVTIGLLVTSAATAGLASSLAPGVMVWVPISWTMLIGVGQAIGFASLFSAAGFRVPDVLQGVASATMSTAQQLGTALGLAVFIGIAAAVTASSVPGSGATATGLSTATWISAAVLLAGAAISWAIPRSDSAEPHGADRNTAEA